MEDAAAFALTPNTVGAGVDRIRSFGSVCAKHVGIFRGKWLTFTLNVEKLLWTEIGEWKRQIKCCVHISMVTETAMMEMLVDAWHIPESQRVRNIEVVRHVVDPRRPTFPRVHHDLEVNPKPFDLDEENRMIRALLQVSDPREPIPPGNYSSLRVDGFNNIWKRVSHYFLVHST